MRRVHAVMVNDVRTEIDEMQGIFATLTSGHDCSSFEQTWDHPAAARSTSLHGARRLLWVPSSQIGYAVSLTHHDVRGRLQVCRALLYT